MSELAKLIYFANFFLCILFYKFYVLSYKNKKFIKAKILSIILPKRSKCSKIFKLSPNKP